MLFTKKQVNIFKLKMYDLAIKGNFQGLHSYSIKSIVE